MYTVSPIVYVPFQSCPRFPSKHFASDFQILRRWHAKTLESAFSISSCFEQRVQMFLSFLIRNKTG